MTWLKKKGQAGIDSVKKKGRAAIEKVKGRLEKESRWPVWTPRASRQTHCATRETELKVQLRSKTQHAWLDRLGKDTAQVLNIAESSLHLKDLATVAIAARRRARKSTVSSRRYARPW